LIRQDKETREALNYPVDTPNCRDIFEVKHFDLNADGHDEILLRAKIGSFCGAVGNCDLWVFENARGPLHLLLLGDHLDDETIRGAIRQRKTNGYRDLVLATHISAAETAFATYKFDGTKYVHVNCRMRTPIFDGSDKVSWHFIPCDAENPRGYQLELPENAP
jgi:hypothetical protein